MSQVPINPQLLRWARQRGSIQARRSTYARKPWPRSFA